MKKIVLVGQFSDISGYGNAVRSYLKSLLVLHQNKEIDLKLINFSFENTNADDFINFDKNIKKLFLFKDTSEVKTIEKEFDELIAQEYELIFFLTNNNLLTGSSITTKVWRYQNESPDINRINLSLIVKNAKNVFPCVVWETDTIPEEWRLAYEQTPNIKSLICACEWNREVFESQSSIKGAVIPYHSSYNVEYDDNLYQKLLKAKKDNFSFCSISQWGPRKGFDTLLKAFFLEFKEEPVNLFLKTYANKAITLQDETEYLTNEINKIKKQLKFYGEERDFKCKVVLINSILSKKEINSIYKASEAYVTCTRGEGFGLPLAEYLNFGKPIIIPDKGGHVDFCSEDNFFINSEYEPCLLVNHPPYSADMKYVECSVSSAMQEMRKAYELFKTNKKEYYNRGEKSKQYMLDYLDLDKNASLFRQVLEL